MAGTASPLTLHQARVAIVVGVLTIAGFIWSSVSYLKEGEKKDLQQDGRISQSEINLTETKDSINKLTVKTDELTKAVVRLTTVIETRPTSDRAALDRQYYPLTIDRASAEVR
jgi:hypothetical protein